MNITRSSAEFAEKAATRTITLLFGVYALVLFAQAAGVIHVA
ncbi:MAG TPA: hypothetical protein VF449_03385 [Parvibaculum sp.]